jgi:hypothetical protein
MQNMDRRAFLGGSAASAGALLAFPIAAAHSAPACVTGGLPAFLPSRLTVDCASRRNFAIYRKNSGYMGLAGCVSMSYARGKYGEYPAGNLFLFPWLNKKGQSFGAAKDWQTVMPTSMTKVAAATPIPNWTMPLDEYFLRYVVQAPTATFIGFRVDAPFNLQDSRRPWFTNVKKLADGKGIGVAWTSSNLNHPWFAGSRWIPNADDCNGNTWRKLIVDGINQASVAMC